MIKITSFFCFFFFLSVLSSAGKLTYVTDVMFMLCLQVKCTKVTLTCYNEQCSLPSVTVI